MIVEEDSNHTTSQIIVDTSSNTVYNNTLRVRGRETTVKYSCEVMNNKLVMDSVTVVKADKLLLGMLRNYF